MACLSKEFWAGAVALAALVLAGVAGPYKILFWPGVLLAVLLVLQFWKDCRSDSA